VLGGQFAQCAQAQPAQNLRSKSDNLAAGYKSMNNQLWNAVLLCFVLLIALATVAAIRRGACCADLLNNWHPLACPPGYRAILHVESFTGADQECGCMSTAATAAKLSVLQDAHGVPLLSYYASLCLHW
jgi:hypothetical protein